MPLYVNVSLYVRVYMHICELSDLWSLRFALHFDLQTPKFSLGALAANSQLPHNCNNTSLLLVCVPINMCIKFIDVQLVLWGGGSVCPLGKRVKVKKNKILVHLRCNFSNTKKVF